MENIVIQEPYGYKDHELYNKSALENSRTWNDDHKAWHQLRYDIEARYYTSPNLNLIFGVPPQAQILDIGSAFGTMPVFLKRLGWERVIATDVTTKLINKKFIDDNGVEFRQIDIEYDPIPSQNNVVLMLEVLEHLKNDPTNVIKKIYNSLSHNGVLILSTPDGETMEKGVYQIGYNLKSYKDMGEIHSNDPLNTHYYVYTAFELKDILTEAGFTIKEFFINKNSPNNVCPNMHVMAIRE